MNLPSIGNVESLGLLFSLLPGLITFLVVKSLTARMRRIEVADTILQALAYTLLVHAIWALLTRVGSYIPTPDIVGLSLCALGLGIGISWLTNSGTIYGMLRRMNLTREASWPSVWETAFREFRDRVGEYVVVELKDGRRLLGAIRGFSSEQKEGHVYLARSRWLQVDKQESEQPGSILVNASDIAYVQFLPFPSEDDDATEST